jgi:hypothetical protein
VFGLKNKSILYVMMHHESIPQIWWNELISHIITNYKYMRDKMVMDQLIPIHKQSKKVMSEKMMDYLITQTKHALSGLANLD